ncbi:WD-40 repeat protein [Reticulomyxa filosa]|uniref:WD-40 repeat protein n=1 Tax=Reticulomyxa filosa TaxID=46433 RepID=X6P5H3_RETFI|nr:WD-40 repeat protein [Reticulomyxa filosa]|eukprot:ETO33426.1 WD-40 repeat protein [Reticulomyxa filosa]
MILTNLLSIMLCFFLFDQVNIKYLFVIITQNYFFMLDIFRFSSKLLKIFTEHTETVWSIDYSAFDSCQLLCSGSNDNTVRVWDVENNKQTQSFDGHFICVRFSTYHYCNHRRNVICFSSGDNNIYFWDIKDNRQLKIFSGHTQLVSGIKFSSFNDVDICVLCHMMRLFTLHAFKGHVDAIWCVDISPLQSNNSNNNKSNNIGMIGGSGHTICSGSWDNTVHIWDIETAKELLVFKGHKNYVNSVKYGSNELGVIGGANTILSGSFDKSVRLWDIRSGRQTQAFNGHTNYVNAVAYSPFVVNNIEICINSNVICSGSSDSTIRFWDIRSNKNELYAVKVNDAIYCLSFVSLKKNQKTRDGCGVSLYFGSENGLIRVWG